MLIVLISNINNDEKLIVNLLRHVGFVKVINLNFLDYE